MAGFAAIELHPEVQKFFEAHGNTGYIAGAKYYEMNGTYYCATNEPNIFVIPNLYDK